MFDPQKPFWRSSPLNDRESELLRLVLAAHSDSARRQNVSSHTIHLAGNDYCKALAAGLLSLGGVHAPLEQTRNFLKGSGDLRERTQAMLNVGKKIPGWGNSFFRGVPDPLWADVHAFLGEDAWPLDAVTGVLRVRGKNLFPNPSAYTALAGMILGMSAQGTFWILVSGRLDTWSEIFANRPI